MGVGILLCFSEKKYKRLKPGKKIHESRILADYLWVLLLLVIIFCISTQRGRKPATGAASIPSDLEWIASLFKQVTPELNFPTVASLSKDKGMKTNKEVPWSKGDAELPHTFMDIFSLIWNSGPRPRLLYFLPPCNSHPSNPRHNKKQHKKVINIYCALYYVPGEGNGTPLQYSCLENPMDGRAW